MQWWLRTASPAKIGSLCLLYLGEPKQFAAGLGLKHSHLRQAIPRLLKAASTGDWWYKQFFKINSAKYRVSDQVGWLTCCIKYLQSWLTARIDGMLIHRADNVWNKNTFLVVLTGGFGALDWRMGHMGSKPASPHLSVWIKPIIIIIIHWIVVNLLFFWENLLANQITIISGHTLDKIHMWLVVVPAKL